MKYLITGGCGFIGSNFIRALLVEEPEAQVFNIDLLTYAGNRVTLADVEEHFLGRYAFEQLDIADQNAMEKLFQAERFDFVINFAAESHVDRSIAQPQSFIRTNVLGTSVLLECCKKFGIQRFVQVSTDEVYGSLDEGKFTEKSPILPSSPYSASKAAADHLALAYFKTYGLDVVITRCSNNYGPYQFPEKLIPLMIIKAMRDEPLPVYGDGLNVRDWIYVLDHCSAVKAVLDRGRAGDIYNIGADGELKNLQVVKIILRHLGKPEELIRFVTDRLGHDRRYAIDSSKLRNELGWQPTHAPENGICSTVDWYVKNRNWWEPLLQEST